MGINESSPLSLELPFDEARMGSAFNVGLKPEELDPRDRKFLRINGLSDQQVAQVAHDARESARRQTMAPPPRWNYR